MTPARRITPHRPPRARVAHARRSGAWPVRVRAVAAAMPGVVGGLAAGLAILVNASSVGHGSPARTVAPMPAVPHESVASVIAPAGAMAMAGRDREEDAP